MESPPVPFGVIRPMTSPNAMMAVPPMSLPLPADVSALEVNLHIVGNC